MIPYLCGGTFLAQILRAMERTTTSTDHMNGQKESLPEREIFRRLLSIYRLVEFPADAGGSIKTYASQFKVCQNSLASFTGFADNDSRMRRTERAFQGSLYDVQFCFRMHRYSQKRRAIGALSPRHD